MASSLAAGRPPTACLLCKRSKVRCSGDVPRCKRCTRSDSVCEYPQSSRRTSFGRRQSAAAQSVSSSAGNSSRHSQPHINPPASSDLSFVQSADYLGLPESVVTKLIDSYFACYYNARLLLHPAKLRVDRERGAVRPHVLLAVCAMGAIFYRDERGSVPYREFAPVWADRAGKLVLNEAETPGEDNVVTFSILALFWYMQGSWRRSYMHNGNAMQTTHILNLVSDGGKKRGELNGEISRRRFWACFLTNCHTSDSLFTMGPPGALAELQLPWRDEDFERGSSEGPQAKFGSKETNGGLYSEMVRGMSYWSSVSIMTRTPDLDPQGRIASIHQLDAEIRKWWSCVPKGLQMTAENVGSISPLALPKILLVNIAYYQCLCALHASIVPLFVWGQHIPEHEVAKQLSAQLAYENAGAISRLLEMALGKMPDMIGVSSFVGYAAYCSYAVQIPFHWCMDTAVMERARNNTSVNIRAIRSVGRDWKSVALLETYAMYLANIHSNNQLGLGSEPKGLDPAKLSGFRITAARARSSILSINGILWKEDGFAAPGDEVTDLGLGSNEERLPARAPTRNWTDNTRTLDTVNETPVTEGNESMPGTYAGPTVAVNPEMFDFSDQQAPVFFHPFLYMSDMLDPNMGRDYEAPSLGGVAMGGQW